MMDAGVNFGWSDRASTQSNYKRPAEVDHALSNLQDGQTVNDLSVLELHPDLHHLFGGNLDAMPLFRWPRIGSRAGHTLECLQVLKEVHARCHAEACRLSETTDDEWLRNQVDRWLARSKGVRDLPFYCGNEAVDEVAWLFHIHPARSDSLREAMQLCVLNVPSHHEHQRRHLVNQALTTNLGGMADSEEPWAVALPQGFVQSFRPRLRPANLVPPTPDARFFVLKSSQPGAAAVSHGLRRRARQEPVLNMQSAAIPLRSLSAPQRQLLDQD